MGLSKDSKLEDVMKNPKAAAIIEEYVPGASKDPKMKLAGNLTLTQIVKMSAGLLSPDLLEDVDKKLKALGD